MLIGLWSSSRLLQQGLPILRKGSGQKRESSPSSMSLGEEKSWLGRSGWEPGKQASCRWETGSVHQLSGSGLEAGGMGGGRVWESRLGRRARKDLHSCWPVNGSEAPPDPASDCRPIHMQIPRELGGCAQQLRTGKLLEDCERQSLAVFFLCWAAWLKVSHSLDWSESTDEVSVEWTKGPARGQCHPAVLRMFELVLSSATATAQAPSQP